MENEYFRVSAEIDLDAIRSNILNITDQFNEKIKTCLVVKANAYGHGAVVVAKEMLDIADFFAVATIDEAMELRTNGIEKPILVLGYVHESKYGLSIDNDIRLTIYSFKDAEILNHEAGKRNKKAIIHIKIDTGMNRIGFVPDDDSFSLIETISKMENIDTEGIFTHLFSADASELDVAEKQVQLFKDVCTQLSSRGIQFQIKHCFNSAASMRMSSDDFDMIRLGIVIYGLNPSEFVSGKITPAMSFKSHITMLKTINPGESVGYGATWVAKEKTQVATISVGYADGYPRKLSNKGYVLINGQKAPIIGNVCMDQTMVDVNNIENLSIGDEVCLVGYSNGNYLSMDELASLCGTINYEFACNVSPRVIRRYIKNGTFIDIN